MSEPTPPKLRDRIWEALASIQQPGSERSIVDEGLVTHVAECGGRVAVTLRLEALPPSSQQELAAAVERAVAALDGVRWVRIRPASEMRWSRPVQPLG
ncbi:MAG TPA: iron-sulfur cluster assembly protein [Limnochordales bacterium]